MSGQDGSVLLVPLAPLVGAPSSLEGGSVGSVGSVGGSVGSLGSVGSDVLGGGVVGSVVLVGGSSELLPVGPGVCESDLDWEDDEDEDDREGVTTVVVE